MIRDKALESFRFMIQRDISLDGGVIREAI